MKNLSNSTILSVLINLAFLTLIAKLLSIILLWFLPMSSEGESKSDVQTRAYRHFNFQKLITGSTIERTQPQIQQNRADIKSMILIGLYGNSSYGYAIVAMKSAPKKSEIISVGESYQGYKLKRIALYFVVFVKNNKEYILRLNNTVNTKQITKSVAEVDNEESIVISRSEINTYTNNPAQIWRDISIKEVKSKGKIFGFKVMKVRKNSKIARLGLQSGDIIIKANDVALKSYNEAIKIYQNLNKRENISLVIKRGNEEKEIIYEIH